MKLLHPDPSNPPSTAPYFKFYAEKWDHEYARNVLLHFINQKKLNKTLDKWLEKHYPDERD